MKVLSAVTVCIFAAPAAYPQNKETLQLMRDMIALQQQMKQLQTTIDQNDALLKGLVEKMADQVNTLSSAMQKVNQAVESVRTSNDKVSGDMRNAIGSVNSTL